MSLVATLPMYDWPEIRSATDSYWHALRDQFRSRGFAAPEELTRSGESMALWQSPNLLFAQTCGLPYVQRLGASVSLIGTPAYDICCGAGSYFSVLIVHADSDIMDIAGLPSKRFAYNDPLSQSGFAAACNQLQRDGIDPTTIGARLPTGSHRASIRAVAEGKADFAAIDAVTWELAKRHEAATAKIRVLKTTSPTPGLPYITAKRSRKEVDRLHMAVIDAMASLEESLREDLLLIGLTTMTPEDYGIIKSRFDAIPAPLRTSA